MDRETLSLAWNPTESEDEESTTDHLLPPLHQLLPSSTTDEMTISSNEEKREMTIVAYLDRLNPLTEARWVKTGDVEGWIGQLAVMNGTASKWKGKITVSDPDPVSLVVFDSKNITDCECDTATNDATGFRELGDGFDDRFASR